MNVQPKAPSNVASMIDTAPQTDDAQVEGFEASLAQALAASGESEVAEEVPDRRFVDKSKAKLADEPGSDTATHEQSLEETAILAQGQNPLQLESPASPNRSDSPPTTGETRRSANSQSLLAPPDMPLRDQSQAVSMPRTLDSLSPARDEQPIADSNHSPQIAAAPSPLTNKAAAARTEPREPAGSGPADALTVAPTSALSDVSSAGSRLGRQAGLPALPPSERDPANRSATRNSDPSGGRIDDSRPVQQENSAQSRSFKQAPDPRLTDDVANTAKPATDLSNVTAATPSAVSNPLLDYQSLGQAAGISNTPLSADVASETTGPQPIEVLPSHIEMLASRGGGTARLRLHPGELGEIEITVSLRGNAVDVTIHADRPAAHAAVLSHRESLAEALGSRDLRMEGFDVSSGGRDSGADARQAAWSGAEDRRQTHPSGIRVRDTGERTPPPLETSRIQMAQSQGIDLRI